MKSLLIQARDALSTCRVMGADADGNYTKEITPRIISSAIAALTEYIDAPEHVGLFIDMIESHEGLADELREPLTNGEIYTAYIEAANQTLRPQDERIALAFAHAIELAHGIGAKP